MLRRLSAAGLTAAVTLTPPDGFKWRILMGTLRLITSATAGSRQANLAVSLSPNIALLATGSQTGVSTTYTVSMGSNNGSSSFNNILYMPVQLPDSMSLILSVTLIAGDAVSYDVLVDEVLDE